mmetsp:Transcript_14795/g.23041  ORF Transcript_14795/g.23041 Transcript_14795/m.23041 type:complete len:316 (-) Transcript_14795:1381-2328(-)
MRETGNTFDSEFSGSVMYVDEDGNEVSHASESESGEYVFLDDDGNDFSGSFPEDSVPRLRTPDDSEVHNSHYYEVLDLSKNATEEEIKRAYRKQALRWHPDKNPDNKTHAEEMFKTVSHAYSILSNPEKKTIYDKYGERVFEEGAPDDDGEGGFQSPDEVFRSFFGDDNPLGAFFSGEGGSQSFTVMTEGESEGEFVYEFHGGFPGTGFFGEGSMFQDVSSGSGRRDHGKSPRRMGGRGKGRGGYHGDIGGWKGRSKSRSSTGKGGSGKRWRDESNHPKDNGGSSQQYHTPEEGTSSQDRFKVKSPKKGTSAFTS